MALGDSSYDRQVQAQIDQYADADCDMHGLAPVARYHNDKRAERLKDFLGTASVFDIFAKALIEALDRSESRRIGSLGSGDCAIEILIARTMRELGAPAFQFVCYELSPVLAARGRQKIAHAGLADVVSVVERDLNDPAAIEGRFAAFLAFHSLHHILGLETLFDAAHAHLDDRGAFVIADMIGRNGHARWPEVRGLIREIWPRLPDRYKFDNIYNVTDHWFENKDCSTEGFEGIRAQDILPLLIERFHFEAFYAEGGLLDVFIERSFGPNFSPSNDDDITFIDSVRAAEDVLLDAGRLTPTVMIATLRKDRVAAPLFYAGRSPAACVRRAEGPDPAPIKLAETAIQIPYESPTARPVAHLAMDTRIAFGASGNSADYLRWGWATPDPDFRWAVDERSALEFSVASDAPLTLTLEMLAYIPSFASEQRLRIEINDAVMEEIVFDDRADIFRKVTVDVPGTLIAGRSCLLEIVPSVTRRPDLEDGADKRPITFALVSLCVAAAA